MRRIKATENVKQWVFLIVCLTFLFCVEGKIILKAITDSFE